MAATKKTTAKKATAKKTEYYYSSGGGYVDGPFDSLAEAQKEAAMEGADEFDVFIKQGSYKVEVTTNFKELK